MTLDDLLQGHRAQLGEGAATFDEPDLQRHVQVALTRLGDRRPTIRAAQLTVEAGTSLYAAPADLVGTQTMQWGGGCAAGIPPWHPAYPGPFPRMTVVWSGDARMLALTPAPTTRQVAVLGATLDYTYRAAPQPAELVDGDEGLVLLAAAIEAVRSLAARNIVKPIQLHRGVNSIPNSGTPATLLQLLQTEWASRT